MGAGSSSPLVTSYEAIEMLADPFGNSTRTGESTMEGQGRVEFLVEVCDPCEGDDFAYTVNGVLVSDFCTPAYYDPVQSEGVRYSFTGAITAPHQVLDGGYLTWREPVSNNWFQQRNAAGTATFKDF